MKNRKNSSSSHIRSFRATGCDLSVRPSIRLSARPSVDPSDHAFVRRPSLWLSLNPSVHLTVRPSIRLSAHPSVDPSDRAFVRRPSLWLSLNPSFHLSVRPSTRRSVLLTARSFVVRIFAHH